MDNTPIKIENESNILKSIYDSSLITQNDISAITEARDFIISTYTDTYMFRPLPVKLFGVLNDKDFPTKESKFWQCKIEAETHVNEMVRETHELELMKLNIDRQEYALSLLQKKVDSTSSHVEQSIYFDIRELHIKISRLKFEYRQLEKKIKFRMLEIVEWKKISDNLLEISDSMSTNYAEQYINTMKHRISVSIKDKQKILEKEPNNTDIKNEVAYLSKQLQYIDLAIKSNS